MAGHTRPMRPDGTCPSGFVKRGGTCVRKDSLLVKQERRPGESKSECVDRKIPILINEGMDQNQAIAVANSLCKLSKNLSLEKMREAYDTILEKDYGVKDG